MDDVAFDAVSRRASLVSLGMAGLAATVFGARTTEARNKNKSIAKKAKQKCQGQVGQCIASYTGFCDLLTNDPVDLQECVDFYFSCCQLLADCDAGAFLICTG
jgi:hypothetical protein